MPGIPEKQKALLDRWMTSLIDVPELDVVWLEGSLVGGERANPVPDIDIRFGIADDAYERLWREDPAPLLAGMGEYLPLEWHWRFLTANEGLIVEIMAFPTGDLDGKELYEWEILFSRLPEGKPEFAKLPDLPPAESWPDGKELTPGSVRELAKVYLLMLAHAPASFHNGEFHSSYLTLDWMRIELIKVMYRRIGLAFAKRSKHLSEVLPSDFLADLDDTLIEPDRSPRDLPSVAEALLRTFWMMGKHLRALSEQAGGGFEAEWYDRLYGQTAEELRPYLTG